MTEAPNASSTGGEVIVVEDPDGALVIGDGTALEAFIAEWESRGTEFDTAAELTGGARTRALSMAANVASVGAAPVKYLQARNTLGVSRGGEVVIRKWVKGPNGKIIENSRINPKTLVKANPELLLASAAIQLALADATREITAAIERVEDKTDDVLRLASAERMGDVNGRYQLLKRMVKSVDDGDTLTATDWSSVASLRPDLEAGVEQLRNYLERLIADLPAGLPANERSERLTKAADKGRLGETLQLLTISQQSLYLWQRLRIERVDAVEHEHLEQTIASAQAILADQLKSDLELVAGLRETLTEYGSLTALEFYRKITGKRLRRNLSALQTDFDMFLQARGLQVQEWEALPNPTAKDALEVTGKAIADQGRFVKAIGTRAFDKTLDGVGRVGGAVQEKAAQRLKHRVAATAVDDRES